MASFSDWNQYSDFSDSIMRKARYHLDLKNQQFLEAVIESSKPRAITIKEGTILWRAQFDRHEMFLHKFKDGADDGADEYEADEYDVELPEPFSPERMKPRIDRAREGRVNPKGIPYFYLSTERETAMAEVRPWIGSLVSVAEFELIRDLTIVDCTLDKTRWPWMSLTLKGQTPVPRDQKEIEAVVWGNINWAFSEPVTPFDDTAEYAPTQVLAEAFQKAGFEGIKYESKVGEGKTIAAFDLTVAEMRSCDVYRVKAMNYVFSYENGYNTPRRSERPGKC
jgi:hypothetical protein